MNLGIDRDKNLVYEGASCWGHPVWPTPTILPAAFVSASESWPAAAKSTELIKYIFREDSYDSVSRVRRGRFYGVGVNSPDQMSWFVYPHPAVHDEVNRVKQHGVISKFLFSFGRFPLGMLLKDYGVDQPLVLLGAEEAFTIWAVVGVEKSFAGDEIVALKARQTFGVLPTLWPEKIPPERRAKVLECLKKLQEDVFRAGPESVVDRARDAASAILRAVVGDREKLSPGADLGELIKKLKDERRFPTVTNAAEIVRVFHSRAKPSVQEKIPEIRPLREQDAELAVQCIGCIICDLGWGEWR